MGMPRPYASHRTLLKPGGRILDITPTPAKFARRALPGPFQVMIARPITSDLEEVARAAGQGTLRVAGLVRDDVTAVARTQAARRSRVR